MRTVIIHGKRISDRSPRHGRPEFDLSGVTRANAMPEPDWWGGTLIDWTDWTDVHPLTATADFPGIPQRRPEAWRWYRKQDGTRPIYFQDPKYATDPVLAAELFASVPGATVFPIEEIQEAFKINGEKNTWFVCQVGMMIAHKILQGYERIILNGIGTPGAGHGTRQTVATLTHQYMHRDILGWVFFARGRGLRVDVEGPSIFNAPTKLYAYEGHHFGLVDDVRRSNDFSEIEADIAKELRRGRPVKRHMSLRPMR